MPTLTVDGLDVAITWTSVEGADGYKFHYVPYLLVEPTASEEMGNRTGISGSLPLGSAYYVVARAVSRGMEGPFSNVEHFVPGAEK